MRPARLPWPVVISQCVDCGVGTLTNGEWYLHDSVWALAWLRRARPAWHDLPGQRILCIGCFEKRIGRRIDEDEFAPVPINDPRLYPMSARMRDRLRHRFDAPRIKYSYEAALGL
jgi:hypothetical protein